MTKAYQPIEISHRIHEMSHVESHATGSLMRYVPLYTAGLATLAVGVAVTEFIMDLIEGPDQIVITYRPPESPYNPMEFPNNPTEFPYPLG